MTKSLGKLDFLSSTGTKSRLDFTDDYPRDKLFDKLNSWLQQLHLVPEVLKQKSRPRSSHCHNHVWLLGWFSASLILRKILIEHFCPISVHFFRCCTGLFLLMHSSALCRWPILESSTLFHGFLSLDNDSRCGCLKYWSRTKYSVTVSWQIDVNGFLSNFFVNIFRLMCRFTFEPSLTQKSNNK